MTTYLLAEDVRAVRDGRAVVDGVSLRVEGGQVVAVTGPSGSGKSTLLAVLAGLEPPDGGTVTWSGPGGGGRPRVGLVLQAYGLVGVLTAAENVEVPLQRAGLSRREVRARATAALREVRLEASADQRVELMSGGQQQRVAVARALALRPDLLVADEPTAQLDTVTAALVLELLVGAARAGAAVVIATHDAAAVAHVDGQVRLRDGRRLP